MTTLIIDYSLLSLLILIVPFLLFVRLIYNFYYGRKDFISKIIILEAVCYGNNNSSKNKIKNYIVKNVNIEKERHKIYLMNNFSNLFRDLEEQKHPLIIRRKKYQITKEAKAILNKYKGLYSSYKFPEKLEVWTEQDLMKLSKKNKYSY